MDNNIPFWEKAYRSDNIMSFSTSPNVFEDEHPDVPKHLHSVNKIVARRPE